MSGDDVLELHLPMELSRDHVQRRIDDWLKRLADLFRVHRHWAAEQGWTVVDADPVEMREELMLEYGVTPVRQPVLRLEDPDGRYAVLKPKGLWVIGANGRIDLYTSRGAFTIIDRAEPFSDPSWRIFRATERREGVPYGPAVLRDLV